MCQKYESWLAVNKVIVVIIRPTFWGPSCNVNHSKFLYGCLPLHQTVRKEGEATLGTLFKISSSAAVQQLRGAAGSG